MCGIAGLIARETRVLPETVRAMTDRIVPRGPDSAGEWVDDSGRVGLGHRRLAILDLTQAGHQPMHSACGRYTVVFNGEIYNFAAIRTRLEQAGMAPPWRGHSDTEVLLAAIAAWGVQAAVEMAQGMFAIALWDAADRTLTLARDRFGEKPLYYGWCAAGFAFASTLAPIRALPGFDAGVEPQALSVLMARAYVPAPWSIYRGVYKLPPGCLLTVGVDRARNAPAAPPVEGVAQDGLILTRWFDYADEVLAGAADPIDDADEALAALDAALGHAVRQQLVADVPVGTFLSGGIDSSLITALAQKSVSQPIRSFTIGFEEAGFDEAVHAKQVAQVLGTDHTELYVTARDALDLIPAMPHVFDEPFADSSQLPTHLVAKLARRQVTVALSGDAGDELFGGYNRHQQVPRVWRRIARLPGPLRAMVLNGAGQLPPGLWNLLSDLRGRRRSGQFGHNARRGLRTMARADSFDALFDGFLDDWLLTGSPLSGDVVRQSRLGLDARLAALPLEVGMMHADAVTYLPDDILCKVDRAAMAVSLETRVPFLDPGVTATAARIAPALKFASGGGKHILKELLYTHVPRALVDRPKAGFAIPVGLWLKGPLRDWAEDLLSESALAADGLFDVGLIRRRWHAHLHGAEEQTQALWSVLMFQAWRRG
ncbi:asparagine synthase (glutamine-hydrolyzing) [Novosphingobium sp. FSY-8]|uniref:asparagine synthase (glutamine-hydrolyzing) n=1 Tax=Novosphingobium ovatum TaxID=1908523 RepID=A0ABW9X8U7_9SPHN|nr:asparagine synthase (glutamine-hydrolyzing) [Novosphingobium ovatum]NBC34940.1 asparagine synthase (glutamine-hydrolyzing) [Novosphingobium ovatum]